MALSVLQVSQIIFLFHLIDISYYIEKYGHLLQYHCHCGSHGSALLDFDDSKTGKNCSDKFIIIKNRLCCPKDSEPLITILDKKVANYEMKVTCKSCENIYKKVK